MYRVSTLIISILLYILFIIILPKLAVITFVVFIFTTLSGSFKVYLKSKKKKDNFILSGSIIFMLVVLLTAPGVYLRDSSEIASAAWTLGIAHPTGFPLIMVMDKAMSLLPAGNIFYRINLFDTLSFIAIAYILILIISTGFNLHNISGYFAALSLIFASTFAMHTFATEVYIPSVLGVAITLYLITIFLIQHDNRYLILASFFTGLGIGGHVSWPVVSGAMLLIAIIYSQKNRQKTPFLTGIIALIIGMLVILYLPVAAIRHPARNWGDPETLSALWAHISGASIRESFKGTVGAFNPQMLFIHAKMFIHQITADMLPIIFIALLGIIYAWKKHKPLLLVILTGLIVDFIFSTWINPMGIKDLQTGTITEFLLALLGAIGAGYLYEVTLRYNKGMLWFLGAAFILGIQLKITPQSIRYDKTYGPQMIISNSLNNKPNECTILTTSDDLTGLMVAATTVQERRPDCLFLSVAHILMPWHTNWEFKRPDRTIPWSTHTAYKNSFTEVKNRIKKIITASPGPVYLEVGSSAFKDIPLNDLGLDFPFFALKIPDIPLNTYIHKVRRILGYCIDTGKLFLSTNLTLSGTILLRKGRIKEAEELLTYAVIIYPENVKALTNLAVFEHYYAHNNKLALKLLKQAITIQPDYHKALSLLQKYSQ